MEKLWQSLATILKNLHEIVLDVFQLFPMSSAFYLKCEIKHAISIIMTIIKFYFLIFTCLRFVKLASIRFFYALTWRDFYWNNFAIVPVQNFKSLIMIYNFKIDINWIVIKCPNYCVSHVTDFTTQYNYVMYKLVNKWLLMIK